MTNQILEKLIDNEQKTFILGSFFYKIPNDIKFIRKSKRISSTACWRGYIGTWEIKENYFFLQGVTGRYQLISEQPLWANWINETIRVYIPEKNLLCIDPRGFRFYSKEKIIKIENGIITRSVVIDTKNNNIITPPKLQYLSELKTKGLDYYFDEHWDEEFIIQEIKSILTEMLPKKNDWVDVIQYHIAKFSEEFPKDSNVQQEILVW